MKVLNTRSVLSLLHKILILLFVLSSIGSTSLSSQTSTQVLPEPRFAQSVYDFANSSMPQMPPEKLKAINEFYKGRSVLVTGGAGFIGSELVAQLLKLDAKVTVLDMLASSYCEYNINLFKDRIEFIQGDIRDREVCLKATRGKSVVFHLAAYVSVPGSVKYPDYCNAVNIKGSLNLLEGCRINKVERLIFSSSCAVYGDIGGRLHEKAACKPISPYGYSKLVSEKYCQQYAKSFGLKTACLRYFNVFGPKQDSSSEYSAVIAKFIAQIKDNKPVTIFGDGRQTRDYIPVERVVEANLLIGSQTDIDLMGQAYNIGTGKSISLLELLDLIKKDYPGYQKEPIFAPARPGDMNVVEADMKKYFRLFN